MLPHLQQTPQRVQMVSIHPILLFSSISEPARRGGTEKAKVGAQILPSN